MRLGNYQFTCRLAEEAILPAFKGSTLRGGLGHALKKTVCALRRRQCSDCLLVASCAYAFIWEGGDDPGRRPLPYLLIPPDDSRRSWRAGEYFNFNLILLGRANDYLPHLIYAVKEMGDSGLGKKSLSSGRFDLEKITLGEEVIWEGDTLQSPARLPDLVLQPAPAAVIPELRLVCLSPVRLKYANHLIGDLPFHLLIRAAMRRISSLEAAHGQGEPPLDYRGLAARAADVGIREADCRWLEFERYSNRQKSGMLLGGVQGTIRYQGDNLADFLPLLRYCEVVGLGKQTTFGLGRIKVELPEATE